MKRERRSKTWAWGAALLLSSLAGGAEAGLITMTVTNLAVDGSNVVKTGTVLAAWNVNGNENLNPTISGITFLDTQPGNITFTVSGGTPAGDATDNATVKDRYTTPEMDALMKSYRTTNFSSSSTARFNITFTGLTIGNHYQAQFLHDRGGSSFSQMWFGDMTTGTSSSTFTANASSSTSPGRRVLVDFTADATTQLFTLDAISFSSGSHAPAVVNAISLTLVPEPASMALLAMGGLMLLARRER